MTAWRQDNDNGFSHPLPSEGQIARILKSGGGDGTSGDMDARLKLLEYRADQADKMFARIDGKLDAISSDVSDIKGTLKGMPAKSFVIGTVIAVVALVMAAIAVAPYLRVPA